MDKRNDPVRPHNMGPADLEEDIFDTNNVASATECTGLTPAIVQDDEELDSYTEIYDITLSDMTEGERKNLKSDKKSTDPS